MFIITMLPTFATASNPWDGLQTYVIAGVHDGVNASGNDAPLPAELGDTIAGTVTTNSANGAVTINAMGFSAYPMLNGFDRLIMGGILLEDVTEIVEIVGKMEVLQRKSGRLGAGFTIRNADQTPGTYRDVFGAAFLNNGLNANPTWRSTVATRPNDTQGVYRIQAASQNNWSNNVVYEGFNVTYNPADTGRFSMTAALNPVLNPGPEALNRKPSNLLVGMFAAGSEARFTDVTITVGGRVVWTNDPTKELYDPGEPGLPDSVTVSPASVNELRVGRTAQFDALVLPTNADDRTVTWTSSDPAIATVSDTGLVTGIAVGGPVTITATANGDPTVFGTATIVSVSTGPRLDWEPPGGFKPPGGGGPTLPSTPFTPHKPLDPAPAQGIRQMEFLSRGLIGAYVNATTGVYLSWRFLGDEPDGISWNIYRDGVLVHTIEPDDVPPESNFPTNPGIVKENVTPSNWTDENGTVASVYEVAPVIEGVEGFRQGMSAPMLTMTNNTGNNAGKGATHLINLARYRPDPTPIPRHSFRGTTVSGSALTITIRDGNGNNVANTHFYEVDMNLLQEFRVAYEDGLDVTQAELDDWVARLNVHNMTPNYNRIPNRTELWTPVNALVDGKITKALFDELERDFFSYVDHLDQGSKLPFAKNNNGTINTVNSGAYSLQEMSIGDFTGNGEYEIAIIWQATPSSDNMISDPLVTGSGYGAPQYVDVVNLKGELLFRVDLGYNTKATNEHEGVLFVQDFDGDGVAELMLKTAAGSRIGNWDEALGRVVYENTPETVIGGEYGMGATREKIQEYIAAGDDVSLDYYYNVINSWSISWINPNKSQGDGTAFQNKRWCKAYHLGQMGEGPEGIEWEFMTAFKYDPITGKGYIVDSAPYAFPYGERNWGLAPMQTRGGYQYVIDPAPGATPQMPEANRYWLENPWGNWPLGDPQGNRPNRYLGAIGSLDGIGWHAISQRGYYSRTTVSAYNIVNDKVNLVAVFDSRDPAYHWLGGDFYMYENRGNHTAYVGDMNGDGRDEYMPGAITLSLNAAGDKLIPVAVHGGLMPMFDVYVNDAGNQYMPANGTSWTSSLEREGTFAWYPLRHGDRGGMLPVDSTNQIRVWKTSEEHRIDDFRNGRSYGWLWGGATLTDAYTGQLIEAYRQNGDWENGTVGNFSNRWPGAQGATPVAFGGGLTGMSLVDGRTLPDFVNRGGYNAIWWVGDLLHQGTNGSSVWRPNVDNGNGFTSTTVWYGNGFTGTTGPNKSSAILKADFWGDWTEELLVISGGTSIAINTSTTASQYGIRTLMHDPMYRAGVGTHNNGYSQHHFASFYLGDEAPLPAQREDIGLPDEYVFTVTYLDDDETEMLVQDVLRGSVLTPLAVSRYGYTFVGWFLDGELFNFRTPIKEDITLIAQWTLNTINYMKIADKDGKLSLPMIQMARNSSAVFTLDLEFDVIALGVSWTVNNANLATVVFAEDGSTATVYTKGLSGNVTLTARAPSGVTHSIVIRVV